MNEKTRKKLIDALNENLEHELGSIVRYLHHSFIVFGPHRDPLVQNLRAKARESFDHAILLGEKITALGGHPSVKIEEIFEPGEQTVEEILKEDLENEREAIEKYEKQLALVKGDVPLDFFLRRIIIDEQTHVDELTKLLRTA